MLYIRAFFKKSNKSNVKKVWAAPEGVKCEWGKRLKKYTNIFTDCRCMDKVCSNFELHNYRTHKSTPFYTPINSGLFVWRVRSHVHASAHAQTYLCVLFVARMKSHSAEKVLFHWIFFFQSFVFVYECHLWIMRYMSIAYPRRWLRRPERCPKRKVSFIWLFCVGFQFCFFLELPKLILYTTLNVKFLPFV